MDRMKKLLAGLTAMLLVMLTFIAFVASVMKEGEARYISLFLIVVFIAAIIKLIKYGRKPTESNFPEQNSEIGEQEYTSQNIASQSSSDFNIEDFPNISLSGNGITSKSSTAEEAKESVKQLKLIKKLCAVEKKQLSENIKAMKEDYTHEVRNRGSKFIGGGKLGRAIRAGQTISRDARKSRLSSDLLPIENKKNQIEAIVMKIDMEIVKLESKVLQLKNAENT